MVGDDVPSQRLVQSIGKPAFLAVSASYVSNLTAMADVVLPVEMWSEVDGHYINLEGKLQKANKSTTCPDDIRSSEAVLKEIAKRLSLTIADSWKKDLKMRTASVEIIEG
jgi:NADH dehydrogenase/NADH:ubiquinone oxidoreductase subunit G